VSISCNDTFDLIGASITEVIGDDPSTGRRARRVAIILPTRVANDLRVASRVACLGYALQSASVVAGLYEIALTSIHVGTSEELALKWTEHRKPLKGPWSVATLTKSVTAKAVPHDPDAASRLYQRYTQFCWAKHGHPMSEIHQVSRRADDAMEIVHGPDDSDVSLRTAWFALAHAAGLALLAQGFFVLDHISPGSRQDALLAIRKRLDDSQMKLLRQGAERWPGVDPFPGQWAKL
jgi:hypothetical protein